MVCLFVAWGRGKWDGGVVGGSLFRGGYPDACLLSCLLACVLVCGGESDRSGVWKHVWGGDIGI